MLSDDKLLELYERTYFLGDKDELLKSLRAIESAARAEALEEAANVPFLMSARPEFGLEFHDKMLLQARNKILELITKEQPDWPEDNGLHPQRGLAKNENN